MSEKISFKVDFGAAAKYEPNPDAGLGGGPVTPVAKDGIYKFAVTKASPGRSSAGNPKIELEVTIRDADEAGKRIYGDLLCGGTDKNGDPNIRQLFDYMVATGKVTVEQVRQYAAHGQLDVEAVIASFIAPGTEFYGTTRTSPSNTDGRLYTRLNGCLPPANAQKAISENKHRWEIRANVPAAAPSGMPTSIPGVPNLPGVTAAAPAAPGLPGLPGAMPPPAAAAPVANGAGGLPGFALPGFPAMR